MLTTPKSTQLSSPWVGSEECYLHNRPEQLRVRPEDINYVVASHLHLDHAGWQHIVAKQCNLRPKRLNIYIVHVIDSNKKTPRIAERLEEVLIKIYRLYLVYSIKSVTAPLEAEETNLAYLASTPDFTFSGGCTQACALAANSSSDNSTFIS